MGDSKGGGGVIKKRYLFALILPLAVGGVSLFVGSVKVSPFHLTGEGLYILKTFRFPRVVFALINGALLGVSGCVYQLILRNPLADGFTTGAAGSSAVGAVVAISLGLPIGYVPVLALVSGLLGLFLVYRISSRGGLINPVTMILAGVVVNIISSSVIGFLKYAFEESVTAVVFWLMGGFYAVSYSKIAFAFLVFVAGFLFLISRGSTLDVLSFDDLSAKSMGVDVDRMRLVLFVVSTLFVAVSVSFCGIIGFVGLIVPHIVRAIFGAGMRDNLLFSASFGASLLCLSDALSRSVIPSGGELPVGIVTSIFGGGFFLYLLIRRQRELWHV